WALLPRRIDVPEVVRNRPRHPRTAISALVCGLGGTALPKYTGEPRRRREEHARGTPWLPCWHKNIRMLSGVLRGESSAVDARPARSIWDGIWLDCPRTEGACPGFAASRYGVSVGAARRYAAGDRLCRPHTCRSNRRA